MSIITCRSHLSRGVHPIPDRRPKENLFNYIGGLTGSWHVTKATTLSGTPLKAATHVEVTNGSAGRPTAGSAWVLRGVISTTRYVTREERNPFQAFQMKSTETACAALIPIRKSAAWWNLARDERREMIEARSRHIATALRFLPAIARRLLHGRDLGEPFDVVTWFEYAPRDVAIFDDLAGALRSSEEWQYVEREIDIRLIRDEEL